jgi:capsid protein
MKHGVEGYSSDDALQEDERSLGLGVGMSYKKLSADLSYTTYNDAKYSVVNDRDYLSLSTTYNF